MGRGEITVEPMRPPRRRRAGFRDVVRRVVTAPLVCILVVAIVAVSPVLLAVTALVSAVADRRWRLPRAVVLLVVYGVHDVAAMLGTAELWARRPGRRRAPADAYVRLLTRVLASLTRSARRILAVRVVVEESAEAEDALARGDAPVIVLSRHHGPGDSFLLVQELVEQGRRPRIVLRSSLRLDPAIDLLGHHLGFCFVGGGTNGRRRALRDIGAAAAAMGRRDALLLFPEGGNYTRERRRRAIERLRRRRQAGQAAAASRLANVVAPRPGGVLAALAGAAGRADVVILAHSGLEGLDRSPWSRIPVGRELRIRMWLVPAGEVPDGDDARVEWLFAWWARIDAWVQQAHPVT